MNQPVSPPAQPLRSPGPLRLLDRWFRAVRVSGDALDALPDASQHGSVVFVVRSAGVLNYLFLSWIAWQRGLPPLRAALGVEGFLAWLARVDSSESGLADAISRGETSMVCLSRAAGPDPFPMLAALQRRAPRPILLVPALLVWTRRPQKLRFNLGEILFGTPDHPSVLANAIGFLLNRERAVLRVGRVADLAAFVRARAAEPDATLGRKIRGALHHHLARELRAVVGPPLKTPERVRAMVLRDKSLRRALAEISADTGQPVEQLGREAERDVKEIESRYSPAFIEVAGRILAWFFGRAYDAIEIDEAGLARVKRAAGTAPLVLCPSHKSHVDYLVLSWVFYETGMRPPHIAAGINLSFWPFGSIARAGGAFFIRRSVRGDRVYTAALRAYVKQLLRDGFPQEFYLEGGRSRTGKMLFPKTGLFSMEVDAWLEGAADDVLFVPVAIDYEQLMEGGAYARELSGGEKKKENLSGLLRAGKVLGRKYGRLHVQFEEPVSLRALAEQRLGPQASSLVPAEIMDSPAATAGAAREGERRDTDKRRQLVQTIATRVAWGIARASTVTPVGLVAAVLLSHVDRALTAPALARRLDLLRAIARERGARLAKGLAEAPSDPLQPGLVADAMARLAREGLVRADQTGGQVRYIVAEDRRTLLDYHRNAVLQRFVFPSLLCASLRGLGGDASAAEVRDGATFLSRLFKLEFMYRPGANLEVLYDEYAGCLERYGVLAREGDRLRVGPEAEAAALLADLTRAYLQSYRVAFETLQASAGKPAAALERKPLVKAMIEQAKAALHRGDLAQREAISRATFENAIEWFVQEGVLIGSAEGFRIDPEWRESRLESTLRVIRDLLH